MDQDHIGWKSWKLTAWTLSPTPSLFVAQRPSTYSQGNMGKFGGRLVSWEKVACWSTKTAISLKRVKIEERSLWKAYRKSQTLFRTVLPRLDPQAGAVSRIRRRIFVRQKSAEKNSASRIGRQIFVRQKSAKKVRLAEYYSRRKYRYTTTVSVC